MDIEGNVIVLVVEDDEENETPYPEVKIKREPEDFAPNTMQIEELLEVAEKHGEYIPIKAERHDEDDYEYEYLDEEILPTVIKSELNEDDDFENSQDPDDPDYEKDEDSDYDKNEDSDFVQDEDSDYDQDAESDNNEYHKSDKSTDKHRTAMLKPSQRVSYVAQLRRDHLELRKNDELLVKTLEQIMRNRKPPPPPEGFYVMDEQMYQCVQCGSMKISLPAVTKHYVERHGPRFLVCFACGVDFRSPTNLYKHEKRCIAPDAKIVLRARAEYLGRKGRSRPFLTLKKFMPYPRVSSSRDLHKQNTTNKFSCQLCSAVFRTRQVLEAHENLHRGERPYQCDVCPAAYTSLPALKRHAKRHSDDIFICDTCNKSFKLKAALISHMNTHLPIRKFGCKECGQRFAQKAALILHVRKIHLGLPPPCACQLCPKRYPRMSVLKQHMKREHGLSIITRKMFVKSLPTMKELKVQESKIVLQSETQDYILDLNIL